MYDLVKEIKPDIVVLTGHDSVLKEADNFLDLENYRNSKYNDDSFNNLTYEQQEKIDKTVVYDKNPHTFKKCS